jgi:hypothetical protein
VLTRSLFSIPQPSPTRLRWCAGWSQRPAEERDSNGYSPLLFACAQEAWIAAHVLLDCGARVDVLSTGANGAWPVLAVFRRAAVDIALLRRMLAADRDSLLPRTPGGATAIHLAVTHDTKTLTALLGSGLPHLTEATNAVATHLQGDDCRVKFRFTPLHAACHVANGDAALALLAAGARVDIAGDIGGTFQTVADWAHSSLACKHRGVKSAIAARAREHAALPAAAAKGLPFGGAGFGVGGRLQLLPPPQLLAVVVPVPAARGSSRRVAGADEEQPATAQRSCRRPMRQRSC